MDVMLLKNLTDQALLKISKTERGLVPFESVMSKENQPLYGIT